MKNAVEWFQGNQGELQPALATGQPASINLPRAQSTSADASQLVQATNPTTSQKDAASPEAEQVEVVQGKQTSAPGEEFLLQSPDGESTPLARDANQATLAMLNRCGLWTIGSEESLKLDPWSPAMQNDEKSGRSKKETDSRSASDASLLAADDPRLVRLACNLCNREESDLRPRVELAKPTDFGMLSLGGRSIWFYLVLAGLTLATLEWWLYQRRVVG